MPKVRQEAAAWARRHGTRAAAVKFGVHPGTISKWVKKAQEIGYHPIPTKSSRPKSHPKQLKEELVQAIVAKRLEIKRSAEVVHAALLEEGVVVSLPSVKRTLDRKNLLNKRSPWQRRHLSVPRPLAEKPGDLVQIDTIHLMRPDGSRIYVFTGLDVTSRFAWAWASERANTRTALIFLARFKRAAPFSIRMLQSDNGSEFSTSFSERARIEHRHSRVRRPNDNAHLERFNRTIQQELIRSLPTDVAAINQALPEYLSFYNTKRHHFGLGLKTPSFVLKCFQAID